jgi:hypothetical protein
MQLTKTVLKWVAKGKVSIQRKGSKNVIFCEIARTIPIEKLGNLTKALLNTKTITIGGQLCCFDGTKLLRGYIIPAVDAKALDWQITLFCSGCKAKITFDELPKARPILCKKCIAKKK